MKKSKSYDVLVIGGGVGGVAAALECARSGLSVALIEKTVLWGGLATTGLVPIYMPLCDGHGRQVTFGIAEELLFASIKYGPGRIPAAWRRDKKKAPAGAGNLPAAHDGQLEYEDTEGRYLVAFNPHAFALGLDEVMESCGADLWFDTLFAVPTLRAGRVTGVEVENKSGRIALGAKCVIDASGDADVAARAGAPCVERGSFPSMLYQYTSLALAREAVQRNNASRLATWHGGGSSNEMDKGYDGPTPKLSGVRGKDVSAFLVESRRIARQKLAAEQAAAEGEGEGRENIYPTALPLMHQIRMTRMIEGRETVRADQCNQRVETSIGVISDCRKAGALWEVPYGSLLPKDVSGLLAVGRCMAAEGYAWQVTRLIQAAALTGQVAGIAATMAVRGQTSPDRLDPADVQQAAKPKVKILHI